MRHGFWAFLSRTSVVLIGAQIYFSTAIGSGSLFAQEVQQVEKSKKTTEPVFRVSKLANPASTNDGTNVARNVVNEVKSPVPAPDGRIADSSNRAGVSNLNIKPKTMDLPAVGSPNAISVNPSAVIAKAAPAPHPLDRALSEASIALEQMQARIFDYTATMRKVEQVNGAVGEPSYMNVKFRCPRNLPAGQTPFSIYMKFLKPANSAGREVVWVDGENEGKLIAHEPPGTLLGRRRFYLEPTSFIAMRGQRYPIYEAGLENLIVKLIEKAQRDRAAGQCEVHYLDNKSLQGRPCSAIQLIHHEKRAPYEFHRAEVYIDKELNMPVRYAAYDWPRTPGAKPMLLEEYIYYNIRVNVGLTDADFSADNRAYKFPRR